MPKIIAVVGMPGSGKTEAVNILVKKGFMNVYFGEFVFDYMKKHNIKINERNERHVREGLRKKYGMDAAAKFSAKKLTAAVKKGNVVIESMYSLEEYIFVKKKYGKDFYALAVYASPKTRHARLMKRTERPLTKKECISRDLAELQKLSKAGPIALADFTIVNEGTLSELRRNVENILKKTDIKSGQKVRDIYGKFKNIKKSTKQIMREVDEELDIEI